MNKIILMGRLTQDPEMRHTTTGKSVCHFRIAVNRKFSKPGDQEQADFFSIVAWEKTGEFCNNYFRKGLQIVVVGRIQNRTWNDEQGNKRITTEVIADEVFFAEGKKDTGNPDIEHKDENITSYTIEEEDDHLPF